MESNKTYKNKGLASAAAKKSLKGAEYEVIEIEGGFKWKTVDKITWGYNEDFNGCVHPGSVESGKYNPTPAEKPVKSIKRHSDMKGATRMVWAIADSMPGASRKEVLAECDKQGIAYYTARTQYQKWFTASKQQDADPRQLELAL